MPKYEGGDFTFGSIKSKRRRKKDKREKVSDYNGQYLSPEPTS